MIDVHVHCHFTKGRQSTQLTELKKAMQKHDISRGILYLIDERDYTDQNFALDFGDRLIPAIALDPRDPHIDEKLEDVRRHGVKIIKLLPYEQQIFHEDFDAVCDYAGKVQAQGMLLTICGAYGSRDVYRTNGVELAAEVLKAGFENPLIVAHGGMVRQLDTHSLMCEYPNLYMDISFTIPYWWGSHVIEDLHFVMEKSNYERIFWGSDYPYHSFEEELEYFDRFCRQYRIGSQDREKLLSGNFEKFYDTYLKEEECL